jgi:hypothetical protein
MAQIMRQSGETGMLYWVFNTDLITILVCHDLVKGEFVLQIPWYPSVESLETDYSEDKCRQMVI